MRPLPLDQQIKIKAWVEAFIIGALTCFIIALFAVGTADAATTEVYNQTENTGGTAGNVNYVNFAGNYDLPTGYPVSIQVYVKNTGVSTCTGLQLKPFGNYTTSTYHYGLTDTYPDINAGTTLSHTFIFTDDNPSEEHIADTDYYRIGTAIVDTGTNCGNLEYRRSTGNVIDHALMNEYPQDNDLMARIVFTDTLGGGTSPGTSPLLIWPYDPGLLSGKSKVSTAFINEETACYPGIYDNDGSCNYYFLAQTNSSLNDDNSNYIYEAEIYKGVTKLCSDTGAIDWDDGYYWFAAFSPLLAGCPEFTEGNLYWWKVRGSYDNGTTWTIWAMMNFEITNETPADEPDPPPDCDFWGWSQSGDGLACAWEWVKYLIIPTDTIADYFQDTYYDFVYAKPYTFVATPLESLANGLDDEAICPADELTIENGSADINIDLCDNWDNATNSMAGGDKFNNGVQSLLSLFVIGLMISGVLWLFWRRE